MKRLAVALVLLASTAFAVERATAPTIAREWFTPAPVSPQAYAIVSFSPSGEWFAQGTNRGLVEIRSAITGASVWTQQLGLDGSPVTSFAWSPDSKTLWAGGEGNYVSGYTVESGAVAFQLTSDTGNLQCVTGGAAQLRLSPDGSVLWVVTRQNRVARFELVGANKDATAKALIGRAVSGTDWNADGVIDAADVQAAP